MVLLQLCRIVEDASPSIIQDIVRPDNTALPDWFPDQLYQSECVMRTGTSTSFKQQSV
jgi:hypothetical protein